MKNKPEPVLRIEMSQQMVENLETLVTTGLYGLNREEAAHRIVEQWMCKHIEELRYYNPKP